ncbi:cadherin repeat domain-containing protein, partial [Spirosoma validum]
TTQVDQLRRINLDGTGDILIKDNFVQTAGPLVLDAANNRLLVVDMRTSQPSTSTANAKIVAVSLAAGNPVSTLVVAPYIAGSTSTNIGGLALSTQDPPTVTTNAVTSFGSSSAVLGGNVTSDGNVTVTQRGVVYSPTSTTPTLANSTSLAIGSGTGSFSATVSSLAGNTTYYVRAFATNAITTSYGPVQTFTTLVPNSAPTNITLSNSSVNENQPLSTVVGSFSTTDPDAGQTFSYSLVAGTGSDDNAAFQIVGNQLRTNVVFNFETKNSYTVRVQTTDNGTPALSFQKAFTITVNNLNELTATVTAQASVSCNGAATGSATITAAGENPPFSYTYRNTTTNTTLAQTTSAVTGLTAGAYSVTVTATNSGFTATTSFSISQPSALSLTTSATNVSQLGTSTGTASVTVSGGTPAYAYNWLPGNPTGDGTSTITSLSAGTYTVVVTDANGCSATGSTTVSTNPDITPLLYARPSLIYGTSPFTVVVDVVEANMVSTTGVITVRITKDAKATLLFDNSVSSLGGRSVQNGSWSYSSDANYYILTTSQSISGGGKLSVGLSGMLSAEATTGVINCSATVMGGGESRMGNNIDADKVEYFQQ